MSDLISRQAAIDALHMHLMYRMGTDSNKKRLDDWINSLPSAQPEERTEERTETHACDLISRQAAIETIGILLEQSEDDEHDKTWNNAIRSSINAVKHHLPSAQPEISCSEIPNSSDAISRQAAMVVIKCSGLDDDSKDTVVRVLEQLPSAQPEVIRCTECKHYREYDSEYVANAVVVQCMADRYPISETIPDGWFCAGAERKDDE